MKTSKLLSFSLALTSAVLLVIPASATVSSWSEPRGVSDIDGEAGFAQITSHNGVAVAVWERFNGTHRIIQSSRSVNGGEWSPPFNLSANVGNADEPQIAVDSNGLYTAIWQFQDGDDSVIQAKSSSNGLDWSPVFNLSAIHETGYYAFRPQIAAGANGLTTAVWEHSDDDNGASVIQSRTSSNGLDWSPVFNLGNRDPSSTYSSDAQIAVDSNGTAIAVWMQFGGDLGRRIQASRSVNGAEWSTPFNFSTANPIGRPPSEGDLQISVGTNGRAAVVWEGPSGGVRSSTSSNGLDWSPVAILSTDESAGSPEVIVDSNGRVTAVWRVEIEDADDNELGIIQSRTSLNGVDWSTPTVNVSPVLESSSSAQLTVNSSNLVTVVWEGDESELIRENVIKSSTSLNGGTWSAPQALFTKGTDTFRDPDGPQVTVDSTGLVTAIWERAQRTAPATNIIESSFIRQTVAGSTPGTPGTPTATAGNGQATVQITPPTTGGSPVTYVVTAAPGGATCSITAPATSCTVTGLTNGTPYTFSSTATNGGGTSGASASSISITPSAPAPTAAPASTTPVATTAPAPAAALAATGADSDHAWMATGLLIAMGAVLLGLGYFPRREIE